MSKEISDRMTITIPHTFVAGAPFQYNLQVGFSADDVILRQLTYGGCTDDLAMSVIQSDLIQYGDGIMGHVIANTLAEVGPPVVVNTPIGSSVSPNSQFKVNKSKINAGQATFNILTILNNGYVINTDADGQLTMTLEFIKYK